MIQRESFIFAQVGMALILVYMLILCGLAPSAHLNLLILIFQECTSRQAKSLAKSFLFFISKSKTLNILHGYKYNGRYFWLVQKCEQFDEKMECIISAVSVYNKIFIELCH